VHYRLLTYEECPLITYIDRSEFIERVWRQVNGEWVLQQLDYHETDWPGGVEPYIAALQDTLNGGGAVFGVFDDNNKLVGVASVNREFFGTAAKYVLLDNMFVSRLHRGKGIGKLLTQLCKEQALAWGAEKLYTCAASSEATIAFYRGLGFIAANEVNQELYNLDPRDIQLELDLLVVGDEIKRE